MGDDPASQIHVDMREPSPATDCLDCVVGFPAAVQKMRDDEDDAGFFAHTVLSGTRIAFDRIGSSDIEKLMLVASSAQDILYRHIMKISILDGHTRSYCSSVIRYFFEELATRGLHTFFILDNTLREDRLDALLELFSLSGIVTTTPRSNGLTWPELSARIVTSMEIVGHAIYVEPDATVNFLNEAKELAKDIPCIATYRNRHPDEPQFHIINFEQATPRA
jgi:hypothetical protein